MMAKPCVCDTWQGLRMWGCGVLLCSAAMLRAVCCVLAEVGWNALPERVRVLYVKMHDVWSDGIPE